MIRPINQRSIDRLTSAQVITTINSGIKELLDNAIDAGATAIDIRVVNQGQDSFSVQDNGSGINEDDFALLAVNHATSKITSFEDLQSVQTLGFRGEALASLCVMGRLVVTTNQTPQSLGHKLEFDHQGNITDHSRVPFPQGTLVEVTQLFSNLRSRRIRLEQTIDGQYRKLLALIQEYAMFSSARITVENSAKNQRNVALRSQGSDIMQRIATVFRGNRARQVCPVHFDLPNLGFTVEVNGVLSKPERLPGVSGSPFQFWALNGRPIKHKKLGDVVKEVFKQANMGDHLLYILDLKIDPRNYDVNVSPDKRTVLFHNELELLQSLREAITDFYAGPERAIPRSQVELPPAKRPRQSVLSFSAFAGHGSVINQGSRASAPASSNSHGTELSTVPSPESVTPSSEPPAPPEPVASSHEPSASSHGPSISGSEPTDAEMVIKQELAMLNEEAPVSPTSSCCGSPACSAHSSPHTHSSPPPVPVTAERSTSRLNAARHKTLNSHIHLPLTIGDIERELRQASEHNPRQQLLPWAVDEKDAEERLSLTVHKRDFDTMEIVGQFNLGFILVVNRKASFDDLFVIDQHASDEIFNFENLQQTTVLSRQPLVVPFPLELSAVEELVVQENLAVFEKNGFSILVNRDASPGKQCCLTSVPYSKSTVFDETDVMELVTQLKRGTNTLNLRCTKLRAMFAMRACRSSIMIGQPLPPARMREVVKHMGTLDKPWNCPHGRPTLRHITTLR